MGCPFQLFAIFVGAHIEEAHTYVCCGVDQSEIQQLLDILCMLQPVLALKQYSFPSEHMMFNLAMKLLGSARFESCKTHVYISAWHVFSDNNMSGRSW